MSNKPEQATRRGNAFLEALPQTSLRLSNSHIIGERYVGSPIINYRQDGELFKEKGQYYVCLPQELSRVLPGSYISPEKFLEQLKIKNISAEKIGGHKRGILGDRIYCNDRRVFEYEEDNFRLNIFHGLTNQIALDITDLAQELARIDLSPEVQNLNRAHYQDYLATIMAPIIRKPVDWEPPAIRIVKDHLATGDTIAGLLATLIEKTKLNELHKVRIDVGVATAQGILFLKKFAKDNGITLEINAGYLAFGLSKGGKKKSSGYERDNQIIHPIKLFEELDEMFGMELAKRFQGRFVVGNMGLASEKVETYENLTPWYWNSDKTPKLISGQYPVLIYLTRGGELMRAYLHYFLREEADSFSEMELSTKRRFDEGVDGNEGLGYGVMVSGLPQEILI